jgi:hypothetical protein
MHVSDSVLHLSEIRHQRGQLFFNRLSIGGRLNRKVDGDMVLNSAHNIVLSGSFPCRIRTMSWLNRVGQIVGNEVLG